MSSAIQRLRGHLLIALLSCAGLIASGSIALAAPGGVKGPPDHVPGPPSDPPGQTKAPRYTVDPSWPKDLPENWLIGQVGGIAVDRNDNIWIIQRQRSLTNDEAWGTDAIALRCADGEIIDFFGACTDGTLNPTPINGLGNPRPNGPLSECCVPAPAVMKFDSEGNFLDGWGGPADPGFIGSHAPGEPGCDPAEGCNWPAGEHGIYVDHNDFVYIAGNGNGTGNCGANNPCPWAATHGADAMVLKFAADGTFIYQIGDPGPAVAPNSNDTMGDSNGRPQPYLPADMEVDPESDYLYIADGYGNHRVLVVDQDGYYVGRWGAYGQNPVDDSGANNDPIGPDPNFKNPVHCVRIVGDLVYVCDRVNNRIQVFDKNVAGAPCTNPGQQVGVCGYLGEVFIAADTLGNGSTWDVDTSADHAQSCLFNPDGTNQKVWILERESLEILDSFGRGGRSAGQFHWVHNLATDSRGNIYTAEVDTGKRAQKFVPRKPLPPGLNSCES
jgi:hypothetical protein